MLLDFVRNLKSGQCMKFNKNVGRLGKGTTVDNIHIFQVSPVWVYFRNLIHTSLLNR
jgi:hypothetical protein